MGSTWEIPLFVRSPAKTAEQANTRNRSLILLTSHTPSCCYLLTPWHPRLSNPHVSLSGWPKSGIAVTKVAHRTLAQEQLLGSLEGPPNMMEHRLLCFCGVT